ncbi:MAG: type II secretion system secretin GspD [Hyphomicrobium sp.]
MSFRRLLRPYVSAVTTLLLVLSCAALGACTLASEQLSLPGPIGSAAPGSPIGSAGKRPGVPLSDPADGETGQARTYRGSGEFTGEADASGVLEPPGSANAYSKETAGGITLTLAGATAAEAAKVIFGDILKVNYTVSEKVQAKVTLNTSQPVSKDALLGIFESILRSEGAAIVVDAGLYKIVPSNEAAASTIVAGASGTTRAGLATDVVPLRYVAAAEMERILKSVAPQTTIARVDTARNLIMVSGTTSELASLRETVSVFDVDWMRGMSVAIHPIETSDPDAIAKELDTIFANDRESPVKGIVRFVPNKRLKSIIVISSRPEYLNKAAGWIKRIDMVGAEAEKQVNVYHVQNRPSAELAQLLQKVYAAQTTPRQQPAPLLQGGIDPALALTQPQPGLSDDSAPRSGGSTVGLLGEPQPLQTFSPETRPPNVSRTPNAAPTDGEAGALDAGVSTIETGSLPSTPDDRATGIQIVADEPNNALIITATASELRRIKQILSRIDVAPNQVLLEATIAEVTLNDNLKFGLRWFFQKGNNSFKLTDSLIGAVAPALTGFSYFLNTPNVQVALNALSAVTDVNIVSSPSMTVMDNKKAVLQIGAEVPIVTQQAVSVVAPGAPIVNAVSFRNTGVILSITPRIGDSDRILLDIEQEVSDAVPTSSSGIDAPTIQQRRIKTTVAVGNGESIILAGMMQDKTTITKQQVPLVGDIPVLGNLFKNKDNTIARTELLIAITPQIIKDPNQMRAIATEFRDKMNFTTRPQRQTPPDTRENIDRALVR